MTDFFKPFQSSTYKMSSSSILQALGKFLPVIYQQGTTTSQRGSCPPCPQAKYHIGDFAEGGVIIWLTHDGMHGLVAAIEDASPVIGSKWSTENVSTGATYNDPLPYATPIAPYAQYYSGYQNQKTIEGFNPGLDNYPAFKDAAGYSITVNGITYDDWFLPSSSELSLMYAARGVINEVSLANGGSAMFKDPDTTPNAFYWSSRENDSSRAWYLDFLPGNQGVAFKSTSFAVRFVRAF